MVVGGDEMKIWIDKCVVSGVGEGFPSNEGHKKLSSIYTLSTHYVLVQT